MKKLFMCLFVLFFCNGCLSMLEMAMVLNQYDDIYLPLSNEKKIWVGYDTVETISD